MKIVVNMTGFTQEQRNLTESALGAILYDRDVSYDGIKRLDKETFEVEGPRKLYGEDVIYLKEEHEDVQITAAEVLQKLSEQEGERETNKDRVIPVLDLLKRRIAEAESTEECRSIIDELCPAS